MEFNDYKEKAIKFAVYPVDASGTGVYPHLALIEELGECFGVIAKCNRKGVSLDRLKLYDELGDVCWNLAAIAQNDSSIEQPFYQVMDLEPLHGVELEACIVERLAAAMKAAAGFRDYAVISLSVVAIADWLDVPVSKFYEMNLEKLSARGAANAIARL